MAGAFALLVLAAILGLAVASIGLKIHGVILCFKKAWYIGAVALFVPFFAEIVSIAKLGFKKDLLK